MTQLTATTLRERQWFIYVLRHPETKEVRYVGWTHSLRQRLSEHIHRAKRGYTRYSSTWIRSLLNKGLRPIIEEIDCGFGDWGECEREWIAFYKSAGARLTNLTDGGEGAPGYVPTPETRARIAAAGRGRKMSDETKAKLVAATKGVKRTPEARERMRQAQRNKVYTPTPETRAKMSAARKGLKNGLGYKHTDEARERMSALRKGKLMPESHRQALSRALTGRKFSDEHRKNIGISSAKRRHSEETKQKMSESQRRRFAKDDAA